MIITENRERIMTPAREAGRPLRAYLARMVSDHQEFAPLPGASQLPWGEILKSFTPDFSQRLSGAEDLESLAKLTAPLISRSMEMISGGVISRHQLISDQTRGLASGGTWPSVPEADFWDPRKYQHERKLIYDPANRESLLTRILQLETDASETHVGRVITMSLPALLAWADLNSQLIPQNEIVDSVRRMLAAEQSGRFTVVTFGCEPYEYEHNPNTSTGHFRRSAFGNAETLRLDAIQGSFRAVRTILAPLSMSGIDASYTFFTSSGNSWELIQRQVMPDTFNYYRNNPEMMLTILKNWQQTIKNTGRDEFANSNIKLNMAEMETQVVEPALRSLAVVLQNCGMTIPDNIDDFVYNSEQWFADHWQELNLLQVMNRHPDPQQLVAFITNENQWSLQHPEAYSSDEQRRIQAALLSFFEQHQYERINQLINQADLALGVEIDEELITIIRTKTLEQGIKQTPLIWGRTPKFTPEGQPGGVAHRQPWFYAK